MEVVRRLGPSIALVLGCAGAPTGPQAVPVPSTSTPPLVLASVPEPPLLAPPLGHLPTHIRPRRYALELHLDPTVARFSGREDIDVELTRPTRTFFLHGKDLKVARVTLTPEGGPPIDGTYLEVHSSGIAAIQLGKPAAAGRARLHIEWDAAFGGHLHGLYRVVRGADAYAFTQFEAVDAREAFPCFDEPSFKTPFDVTLVVPEGAAAIANTKELARDKGRVTFAPTAPLPTYLLAWAVGPLDVVEGAPIAPNAVRKAPLPFRAVAAKGRGKELGYTLAHTGEIVATLESWFGIAYPYDKLDVIAVPDREGAMENAGAITFQESLLLVDEKTATVGQKRGFAGVMAHELAHHWFGDLVTMPWWDDIWLNEAFATWMGTRTLQLWKPEMKADVYLLDRIHDAMTVDALVSARAIRQPIESDHDIFNAFDSITYQKGAAVLSMFERWLGKERFQAGVRAHLAAHAHGTAVADDLLAALAAAASPDKKNVGEAFHTFLDRPGVPWIDARLECGGSPKLALTQSRFFPVGSHGQPSVTWQVPICVRFPDGKTIGERCALLTEAKGSIALPLEKCPAWVLPNADAAGYYRFGLPREQLRALLTTAWPKLETRERLAVVDAVSAGFARGTAKADDVLGDLAPMASDPIPSIAAAPIGILGSARDWLDGTPLRAHVESWSRKLYGKAAATLGFTPSKTETPERTLLRQNVLSFLALTAKDPAVRKEAAKRGRAYVGFGTDGKLHPEAVDPNLANVAVAVAAEEGDAKFFDALLAQLERSDDALVRGRLLTGLGSFKESKLAARAQALTLDVRLRANEVLFPLSIQLGTLETRLAAWAWLRANFDLVVTRLSPARAGALPYYVRFCDEPHVAEVEAFFTPRIAALDGGPRNLASALEYMRLCVARRDAQEPSMRAFFTNAK